MSSSPAEAILRRLRLFLLGELVRRDFRARYAGSLLGFLWSFAQPLWQLVLFTFVFSWVLRISLVGERTQNFALYLFCGLLPYMALSEGVNRAATAIIDNAPLVKKLRFPLALLVVTVVATAFLHEAVALSVFVVVLTVLGEGSLHSLPLLAVAIPLQLCLTLGLGLLLATLQVFVRDTVQALALLFSALFYFTPIVYPLSMVPEQFLPWIALNPLTPLVAMYRSALLGGSAPSLGALAPLLFSSATALAVGLTVFHKCSSAFADEL